MKQSIEELKTLHELSKPELKQALINIQTVIGKSDGRAALFIIKHISDALTSYDSVGDRLFAEIDNLKGKLEAKLVFVNNGNEDQRWQLQEQQLSQIESLQKENEQMRYCLDNIANRPIGVFGEGFGYDFHYKNLRESAKKCLAPLMPQQEGETNEINIS